MNSENSKTSVTYRLVINLTNKMVLRKDNKRISLLDLSIYYTWKNIKNSCGNKKFKISGTKEGHKFELTERAYSVSDIQDYFKCIIKKHETLTDKSPFQIYVNKIQNRIAFKIKTGNSLEFSTLLLWSAERKIAKNKNGENGLLLENNKVVLVHCKMSIISISAIQTLCVHLLQKSHSVSY